MVVPTDEASTLFSTYHDRIYRYLLSLVHNPSEAEDLTQDTFLRAYSHRLPARPQRSSRLAVPYCHARMRGSLAPACRPRFDRWRRRGARYRFFALESAIRAGDRRTRRDRGLRAALPGFPVGQLPSRHFALRSSLAYCPRDRGTVGRERRHNQDSAPPRSSQTAGDHGDRLCCFAEREGRALLRTQAARGAFRRSIAGPAEQVGEWQQRLPPPFPNRLLRGKTT